MVHLFRPPEVNYRGIACCCSVSRDQIPACHRQDASAVLQSTYRMDARQAPRPRTVEAHLCRQIRGTAYLISENLAHREPRQHKRPHQVDEESSEDPANGRTTGSPPSNNIYAGSPIMRTSAYAGIRLLPAATCAQGFCLAL
jgi:hypothetical protein